MAASCRAEAVHAVRHEPLLPAPDARLRLAAPAHDLGRAETVRGRQDDLRPPDVLLRAVPVRNDRFQTDTVGGADFDGDVLAHTPDSHIARAMGILCQTRSTL